MDDIIQIMIYNVIFCCMVMRDVQKWFGDGGEKMEVNIEDFSENMYY